MNHTAPNDRFSYLYICPEGEGMATVAAPAYELMAADGSKVETRDESKPLPDFGSGDESIPDTGAPDTDAPADPDADTPDESGKAPNAGDSPPPWCGSTPPASRS